MLLEIFYIFCILLATVLVLQFALWSVEYCDKMDKQKEAEKVKKYKVVGYLVKKVK